MAHFVVVTDPAKKAALAGIWRRGRAVYAELPISWRNYRYDDPEHAAATRAMVPSVEHLSENLARVPVVVVPCVTVRTDTADVVQSLVWGARRPPGASAWQRASVGSEPVGPPSTSPMRRRPPMCSASPIRR